MRHAALLLERFDLVGRVHALSGPGKDRERQAGAEAYSAGFADGQAAAAGAAREQEALLVAAANALSAEYADAPQRIAGEAAGALRIILERLFPALAKHGFAVEAAALFLRVARETGAPSLEIFTAPENVDLLRGELRRREAPAAVTVSADPALSGPKARAAWSCGGVELDLGRATEECLAALDRAAQSINSESEL
jgi:hypothetical protein